MVDTVETESRTGTKQTAESVAQDAVDQTGTAGTDIVSILIDSWYLSTGFGKFNLKVMAVCSLIFMNVAFSITSIGFVLPSAACDFKMTTVDKGRLSAAPMLGKHFNKRY
ncbi:hypothetical protein E2986_13529 [Frieseomelitta varia]|uniref:Uncharacterized protein n=1 Tax=Frieseomelitta varia TaxID=561572 RepID=A0A833RTY9_9HYME|nr:hypothetical protein E2986_13529 [Frieseomelitta varia]